MYSFEKREGFIHFIQEDVLLNIKIGFTSGRPLLRLSQLSGATSQRLDIIGIEVGSLEREKRLHKKFRHLHVRNEWFRPEPALVDYVRQLTYGDTFEKGSEGADYDNTALCVRIPAIADSDSD